MSTRPDPITVETRVNASVAKVWTCWVTPEHIVNWNAASDDWHTPRASNDLRVGGRFNFRMEAKDGSMGFDMEGEYTGVEPHALIVLRFWGGDDQRDVRVEFREDGDGTVVTESFTPEATNPVEMQRQGWQSILENFRSYVEGQP